MPSPTTIKTYNRFATLLLLTLYAMALRGQTSVLTVNNDIGRTGANPSEGILNTSNVNASQFGKIFSRAVDGYIYAQPLYVPNLNFPDSGVHNVVFVATMNNTVYAFDADDGTASAPLWRASLGPSVPGTTAYFPEDETGHVAPTSGILSTPVIDPGAGTIFAVALVLLNGNPTYELHALDLITGSPRSQSPAIIQGSVTALGPDSVNGVITFSAQQQQRTGLLLVDGKIYFAFSSYGDHDPYHGWIMGYDALTLQQTVVVNLSPKGQGGIWQSGGGLSADSSGFIYVCTGNGAWDGIFNFGESCLKLDPSHGLSVADYFTPYYYGALNVADEDLGGGRPLLIPRTNLILTGGKQSLLYVLDRNNLGQVSFSDLGAVEQFAAGGKIFSPFAYWDNSTQPILYAWGSSDFLKAYAFNGTKFNPIPIAASSVFSKYGGGLTVSSNGSAAGSGIVWATTTATSPGSSPVPGTLRAFDAANVANQLWNSDQNAARDALGNLAKFAPPTVANGKVYAATFSNYLAVYGLLPAAPLVVSPGSVSLGASQFQPFAANAPVNWTIDPSSVGSISANGIYVAPAVVANRQTVTVTATLIADSTKTASVTVTLVPVSITVSPASANLSASQSQLFAVTSEGNTTVTWSVPANSGSISSGGLYFAPASISQLQNVTVTATSIVDNSKTATAMVTLNPPPPPQIVQPPQNATVLAGQIASFSVTASGAGLSYQWQSMASGTGSFSNIVGATASSYTTLPTSLADTGSQFRCMVSNPQGSTPSNPATLVVLMSGTSFVISQTPGRLRKDYGGWVGMRVTVGVQPIVLSALGRMVAAGNSRTHTLKIASAATGMDLPGGSASVNAAAGAAGGFAYGALASPVMLQPNASYYVLSQEQQNGDQWYDYDSTVQTTNAGTVNSAGYGSASPYIVAGSAGHAYVLVNFIYTLSFSARPVITQQPQSVTLIADQTASFSVTIAGAGSSYQWQSMPFGTGSFSDIAGATASSYTTPPASLAYNGAQFRCVVSNPQGSTPSNPATLAVLASGTSFVITQTPGRLRKDYGGWAGMRVTVGVQPIVLSALGRMVVAGNNRTHIVKVVYAATGMDLPGGSASVNTAVGAAGGFAYGALVSPITLQANTTYYILSQEQPNADQWYDYDTTVQTTNAGTVNSAGYGIASPYIAAGSAGHTYVLVNFIYTLSFSAPPNITQQPRNVTLIAGQTASFSVSAAGAGSSYQWQSMPFGAGGFSDILGATSSSYTTLPTSLADSGAQFRCVVSNPQGSTPSNPATLVVVASGTSFVTSLTSGRLRRDYSGWVGTSVTVAARPLVVGALGRMVAAGNSQIHTVKIVNATTGIDLPGGSASVSSLGSPAGSFAYGVLTSPVTLQPNTTYLILSQEQQGGDQWYDYDTIAQTTADGVLARAAYSSNGIYAVIPASAGHLYGPVNFKYVVSGR